MAQAHSPPAGMKRGPGRPTTAAQPPLKKVKTTDSLPLLSSPSAQSSSAHSPAPPTGTKRLPTKLSEYRPLPTLPSPQPLTLPASTHRSLAESSVVQVSFDRSRLQWIHNGIFDKYWVKPESGKNARPPPPNNPEAKWMKHRGPCRIRVEPHIFECGVYIEEKPQPPVQKVQQSGRYEHAVYGAYGAPYRQGQGQYSPSYGQQQRPGPPMQQPTPVRQSPVPPLSAQGSQQSTPQQADKKAGPDPVISMLATRASSDPELKALMKEVATGAATQEQLKVFQGHIDELTKINNEKKKMEEEEAAAAEAKKAQEQQQEAIQYDGAVDMRPRQPPQQQAAYQPQQQQQSWPPPPPMQQQPPPPPTAPPVIIQFTTPGATEDRFVFPQHSILESLSPQHLLCSTMITRKGLTASDSTNLSPQTEYFQPVTFMVEVAYGRENLIELVKKWVKPADEVKKHMEETMARCTRAPDAHLAMRLPVKGSEGAETEEERIEEEVKIMEEVKKKAGPNVKYVKKPGPKKGEGGRPVGVKNGEGGKALAAAGSKQGVTPSANASAEVQEKKSEENLQAADVPAQVDGAGDKTNAPETVESGRPKRAARKSVRISEG